VNERAGITTLPVDNGLTQTLFDGNYISTAGDEVLSSLTNPARNLRQSFGCVSINNTSNVFYRVLLAR